MQLKQRCEAAHQNQSMSQQQAEVGFFFFFPFIRATPEVRRHVCLLKNSRRDRLQPLQNVFLPSEADESSPPLVSGSSRVAGDGGSVILCRTGTLATWTSVANQ